MYTFVCVCTHFEEQTICPVTFKGIVLYWERRSPVAFRVGGTPPWSLWSTFSCFSAGQSLLFPPNDQTILNVYTMHLRLNGNLCSALARSHSFHSAQRLAKYKWCRFLIYSFFFLPWFSLGLSPHHLSSIYCITITLMQDPFRTVLERLASTLRQRGYYCEENVQYKQLKRIDGNAHNGIWKLSFFPYCLSFLL